MPPSTGPHDARTTDVLGPAVAHPPSVPPKAPEKGPPGRPPFDLPAALPGASAQPIVPPRFAKDTPATEREKAIRKAYPEIAPVGASAPAPSGPMTLAELQHLATENSPVIRRAAAEADAQYGAVIQAGLYPNPTVGYQVDQIQPGLRIPPGATFSGAGQQGAFINQLIKTAGKLSLAQKVAGFDYINALVAVRRAQIDVTTAVRTAYFAALVAERGVEVNRALVGLADEVYQLQLKQLAAGEAAGYEPLQLYAQAEQARNALTQAENTSRAAWIQLAAAAGRPDLTPAALVGSADAPAPVFDFATVQARALDQHTDVLTARNTIARADVNLKLQRRLPIPDLTTNQYHQYDNAAQTYQFGVQLGVQLPLWDRNQGNIHQATAQVVRANQALLTTQNELIGQLAEAFGRYNTNRAIAERYRDKIIPNLTRAYRALIRRYQVEPEKVGFNDIVVAQQNLTQALQAYLSALDGQWRAVVDVANLGQLEELFPEPNK
ncbi:MAG TPA: TolC family protein [Gemmata sp.]